jgi:SAM-dependent methyltransferase
MISSETSRHLDIGCGEKPRNPYGRKELYGIDVAVKNPSERFREGNLALEPIPFPDNYFQSVSAYDFLEHVPRILGRANGTGTRLPFVELMNEIWRVLAPNGVLYAQTPAYPNAAAFCDPTHVNFITFDTSMYFTRPHLMGRMYGFTGTFDVIRVLRYKPTVDYELSGMDKISRLLQWCRKPIGQGSHVLWELKAVKQTEALRA